MVSSFNPCLWKYEYFIFEIEDHMKTVLMDGKRKKVRQILHKLEDSFFEILSSAFLRSRPTTVDKLLEILELVDADIQFSEHDLERLKQSSFSFWSFFLKPKYWKRQLEKLNLAEKKEAISLLLEIENQNGRKFATQALIKGKASGDFIKSLQNYSVPELTSSTRGLRSFDEIRRLLEGQNDQRVVEKNHLNFLEKFKTSFSLDINEAEKWAFEMKNDPSKAEFKVSHFLLVFNTIVISRCNFSLTWPQIITILTLLNPSGPNPNILSQIPTGEGKSFIVAAIAIARALSGKNVDIITSSPMLAMRDSTLTIKQGGLQEIYQAFGVSVAHNCDLNEDKRRKAYSSQVVYGELSSFQRDFLLQTFYNNDILQDRKQQCVIIDEVDCMLLDKGNNILFLSHFIPGLESLESLFVFIWLRVNIPEQSLRDIKSEILFDLLGQINQNDLANIHPSLSDPYERQLFWSFLVESKIIDSEGTLLSEACINYGRNSNINQKADIFFNSIRTRKKCINIPSHLHPFVKLHLDNYLENATTALLLQRDVDYVVDGDRTQQSADLNPLVTIIDKDTGTDQITSQWDGGLHQFLQLKEGCQITAQMLKAVFVSNITYIKNYEILNGVTGTLGSEPEKEFLMEMFNTSFLIVPSAHSNQLNMKQPIVLSTPEAWLRAVVDEVRETIKTRSIIVFCDSIKSVKHISCKIKDDLNLQSDKIHTYYRDYENFQFESECLEPGHVIVATNLAGRGTDIKISTELDEKGGLHICLTYLPENVRTEEQAFGRAGEKYQGKHFSF